MYIYVYMYICIYVNYIYVYMRAHAYVFKLQITTNGQILRKLQKNTLNVGNSMYICAVRIF